eukprot:TRINITY_DN13697_c0_g1_i3.p1 TRINITY_DN13697_c0_g1~~TRINITY_DN13697_c0_g1_i3.p1  ORF type:complete len:203 (-),score=20.72 TRINITY_DN13697_c0_g1_i3:122-730(-)
MSNLRIFRCLIPRFEPRLVYNCVRHSSSAQGSSDAPYSDNDKIAPRVMNRNPMNLEMMSIGRKPEGFQFEQEERAYWNKLTLEISNQHTTAEVIHWTGRPVASASTKEWAFRKQLYNLTDNAAVQAVGKIISRRCLETGIREVSLHLTSEEMKKEKMKKFISVIEESGIILSEPDMYRADNPHKDDTYDIPERKVKPWTVLE